MAQNIIIGKTFSDDSKKYIDQDNIDFNEVLRDQVWKGSESIFGKPLSEKVTTRLEMELDFIKRHNLANYFLIVSDYVGRGRKIGCVGPGRAAAAGSMVNYCLGITTVDPMSHGLLFERFVNETRPMPEIDIDVDIVTKQRLTDFLRENYNNIVYGKKPSNCIYICAQETPSTNRITMTDYHGRPPLDSLATDECVSGLVPFRIIEMDELSIIDLCVSSISENIDIDYIPFDDELTLSLFAEGNTDDVVFFESKGMQAWLKEFGQISFNDLVNLYALYRPATQRALYDITADKQHLTSKKYAVPEIKDVLTDTYGFTIYQEQIMQLAQVLASFTPEESDNLRRALGVMDTTKLNSLREAFLKKGNENGYDAEVLSLIFTSWKVNGRYVFSRSHATCYAKLAYQMGYLKAHYPKEYRTAVKTVRLARAMSHK